MNLFILFIWISVGSCCIFVVWEDIELYSLRIGECIINNSEVMELVDGSLLKGFSGEIDGLIVYTVGKKTYARKKPEKVRDPQTGKHYGSELSFPPCRHFINPSRAEY